MSTKRRARHHMKAETPEEKAILDKAEERGGMKMDPETRRGMLVYLRQLAASPCALCGEVVGINGKVTPAHQIVCPGCFNLIMAEVKP